MDKLETFSVAIVNFILKTCIVSLIAFTPSAFAEIQFNDLIKLSENSYKVNGRDPYIVLPVDLIDHRDKYLYVNFGSNLVDTEIELFYKTKGAGFDPFYKASYIVQQFPAKLKLPIELLDQQKRLRLDLVDCDDCTISLSEPLSIGEVSTNESYISFSHIHKAPPSLPTNGYNIPLSDWRLNNLKGDLNHLKIDGDDPFIVSPKLHYRTNNFAGIYFELRSSEKKQKWNDFQLFYQTENHGFTSKAMTSVRIKSITENNDTEKTKFFIPMSFLSQELPADGLLKKIRLDLPLSTANWSLIKAKLIQNDEYKTYQNYIPNKIFHFKHQRASGLGLIKKSLGKIWSDRAFTVSYLLLLIGIVLLALRAYRNNGK